MRLPIRIRVAIYVTSYFAVVVVALSFVLTELYERYSYRSFDVTLQAAASSVANRLIEQNINADLSGIREDIGETISSFENKLGILRVVVYDSMGSNVFSYNDEDSIAQQVNPLSFTAKRRLKQFVTMHVRGKPYRATVADFETGERSQGTVVVMGSLSSTRDSIDRMRGIAFVVAPITILIIGLGSVLIVRKSLRPLEKMARDIDGIQVDRTLAALEVPGTNDEISRVAKSFNALILRIGALIDTQRNFLLDASHELKTPLTVIQTEIEMLLMKPNLTAKEQENLQQLLSEVEYASKLAIDLIYLSKLESSTIAEMVPVNLAAILEEVVSHFFPIAKRKNISLRVKHESDLIINSDSNLLRRALSNVIDNAIKFSRSGGEVWVTGRHDRESSNAIVIVEDKGEGMSREDLPRIFDKFYRTRTARSMDEKGSGLGLSIAKRIVEQHGGRIEIESEPNVGTTVGIILPLAR
jgi:signal transduction histidine kinase